MEKSMIKNRWIFTLCLILMTLCCLSYGVYSLIKADFSASGTIEYNAYFDLDMKAEVLGSTTTISPYYATTTYQTTAKSDSTRQQYNQNDLTDTSWKLSDLIPSDLTFGSTEEIIVKLSITNYAPYPIDIDLTQLSSDSNLYTEVNNTGYIYAYNKNVAASPADTEYITIRFTPKSSSATVKKSSVNFSFKLKFSDRFEATASELTYTTSSSTATISAYTGSKETCVLPRVLTVGSTNYTPALKVGTSSAAGVTLPSTTKKLIVPGTISTISNYAFTKNTNLTDITLCAGVKTLGSYAYQGCTALTNIEIANDDFRLQSVSVKTIGYGAFSGCTALGMIVIPNSIGEIGIEAFKGCTSLTNVYLPSGTAYLSRDCFNSCSSLSSIRLGSSIRSIENNPLTNCNNLSVIEVCSNNSKYGSENSNAIIDLTTKELVVGCKTTIIPTIVTTIGAEAFKNCTSLQTITLSSSVNAINNMAFLGCSNLTKVTVSGTLKTIQSSAFSGCVKLSSISSLGSVKTISSYAFNNCTSLTSITLPTTVTSIENSAFYNCSGITSIVLPKVLSSIGNSAFGGCSSLTSVTFYNTQGWTATSNGSTRSIDSTALSNKSTAATYLKSTYSTYTWECSTLDASAYSNLTFTNYSGNYASVKAKRSDTTTAVSFDDLQIPSKVAINGKTCTVNKIEDEAFSYCSMTSVELPDTITEIGDSAFMESGGSFTEIIIPSNVKVIPTQCFLMNSSITKVILPEGLEEINPLAFAMGSLKDLVFGCPTGWQTSDGSKVFTTEELSDSANVASIYLNQYFSYTWQQTLKDPDYYTNLAFNIISSTECEVKAKSTSISGDIVIPSAIKIDGSVYTVSQIANDGFNGCGEITSITIPETITVIGYKAFYICRKVTEIQLPSKLETIGDGAFEGFSGITSIVIPASVTSIGKDAFASCSALVNISVESGNTVYDSRNNCNALIESSTNTLLAGSSNTVIPDDIEVIGPAAFQWKSNMPSTMSLPYKLKTISDSAFLGTGINSIVIPTGVTTIGANAFAQSGISSVTFGSIAGWKAGSTSLSASNIANRSTAATYLKTTYVSSIWTRDTSASGSSSDYSATFKFTIISSSAKTAMVEAASTSISGDIAIPSSVTIGSTTYSITQVGSFSNCTGITSLKLADSITTINASAFNGCSNIAGKIIIPESVTAVGASAFEYCSKITSVVFENPKTTIGNYAFVDCTSLTSIDLPKNLETISTGLLANCTALTALTIPAKVTKIEVEAFVASGLKTLTIPISVTYMGYGIVNNCTSLTTVTFEMTYGWRAGSVSISPDSLANGVTAKNLLYNDYVTENWACEVTPDVFADKFIFTIISTTDKTAAVKSAEDTTKNPAVKIASGNLVIPAYIKINGVIYTVKYISDNGFEGCTNLTTISIPSTVVNIGADTFAGCTGLRGVNLAEGVQIIGSNSFKNCTALTSVSIPTSVTTISPNAFSGCINLSKVKLEIVDSSNSRLYYWQIGAGSTTVYECTLFASEENTAKMLTSTFQNSTWTLKRKNLI